MTTSTTKHKHISVRTQKPVQVFHIFSAVRTSFDFCQADKGPNMVKANWRCPGTDWEIQQNDLEVQGVESRFPECMRSQGQTLTTASLSMKRRDAELSLSGRHTHWDVNYWVSLAHSSTLAFVSSIHPPSAVAHFWWSPRPPKLLHV